MHLTSSPAIWYAARASGVAAYVVLTVTVAVGMAMGGKAQSRRWPKFATTDVHRFGGLLVGSLIGVHVGAIALDSFMPFSLRQLVVPLASAYRPLWTGLGIAAAELLLALAITNRYQKRLPHRVWRRAHYLNFAVWAAASLHGMFAGTDRSSTWLAGLYAVSIGGVGAILLWRFGGFSFRSRASPRAGSPVSSRCRCSCSGRCTRTRCRGTPPVSPSRSRGRYLRNGTRREADRLLRRRRAGAAEAARARRPARLAAVARRDVAPARVPAERGRVPRPRHVRRRLELQRPLRAAGRSRALGGRELGPRDRRLRGRRARSGCMRRALPLPAAALAAGCAAASAYAAPPLTPAQRLGFPRAEPGPRSRLRHDRRPQQQPAHHRLPAHGRRRLAVPAPGRRPPRPVVPRSGRRVLHARLHSRSRRTRSTTSPRRDRHRTHRIVWTFGHAGVAGSAFGYLVQPGRRVPSSRTALFMVADIQNCRVLFINRAHKVVREFGHAGSCGHNPPQGLVVAERRDAARRTAACS